jgi:hypothetical protein
MRHSGTVRRRGKEAGIALLIAIFVLLLISVAAIAMIISSGTESALAGNYRSSTNVYYAAVAGVEEVRARLRSGDPNSFSNTAPGFLPAAGTALGACAPVYVINPVGGEAITPWDPGNAYYDSEFGPEFVNTAVCGGGGGPPNPSPTTASVWNRGPLNGLPFSGPLYKWVRINGVTEGSLSLDVSPYDGLDVKKLVYYDTANARLNDTATGSQVLEVTALAVLPGRSQNESTQKIVQYLVAPFVGTVPLPPLPAALTLAGSTAGNVVGYSAPSSSGFGIKGLDLDCNGAATGAKFAAVGVVNNADINVVKNGGVVNGATFTGIPAASQPNYPGLSTAPDIENVSTNFSSMQLTPGGLDAMVQSIIQGADGTIPAGSNSTQTSYLTSLVSSGAMSSSSPMTLVANGDLDLTSWHNTGYGILIITGKLTYDPDVSWNGIIMVVGQGTLIGSKGGSGAINGAVLVARTRDNSGNLLSGPNLGYSYVNFNPSMGGVGVNYSNCWVQKSQVSRSNYKILSFHEIGQ